MQRAELRLSPMLTKGHKIVMKIPHLYLLLLSALLIQTTRSDPLVRFGSCDALRNYYVKEGVHRVGPFGLNFGSCKRAISDPRFEALSFAPPKPSSGAGTIFSETNVQVDGVDEPDIIKTDGKRIFIIRGKNFHVVGTSSDGSSGSVKGSLKLAHYPQEILLYGDYVLAIATDYGRLIKRKDDKSTRFSGGQVTVVYQIRILGTVPVLISTLRVEGRYVNAREVDGIARIVVSYDPAKFIQFTQPRGKVTQKDATKLNEKILERTTSVDWLPQFVNKVHKCSSKPCTTGVTTGVLVACDRVYRPKRDFTGFALLTVATVEIAGSLTPRDSVSISSQGGNLYSSATSLYVTTTEYQRDFIGIENEMSSGPLFKTSFHRFAVTKNNVAYIASGEVTGSVLNQFSMHEFKETFFVATTEGSTWWTRRNTTKSKVSAFRVAPKKRLQKVGEVGDLGKGERIFSVRYIEDTVYVVTFRRVDPLYIVDLSNPRKPVVTGELKIAGYSAYLHPIAPGRILGVGQDATKRGRTTGSKVTLFDVSDKMSPKDLSSWTLKGGYSSTEWDHRAFLYWNPEGVVVLPVELYRRKYEFTGSIVLEISEDAIKERGRFQHARCCNRKYRSSIERNLVLGRIFLWSLSDKQLQVNNIQTLKLKSKVLVKDN